MLSATFARLLCPYRCDGKEYDALPSITLALGGATLTLPPSVYMGEMDVDIPVVHRHKIAGIQIPTTRYVEGVRCVPLLSNIEEPTDHGALAILGMPFLRHYATYFDRTSGGIAVAEVAASASNTPQKRPPHTQRGPPHLALVDD